MVSGIRVGAEQVLRAPLRGLPLAQQTLPALLERQAVRCADKPFVSMTGGEQRSFTELRDGAAAWAGLLKDIGIRRGDRVAAIAGNRIELIELLMGCAWMGAIAVPLNTAIRGAQLQHALTNSGARTLVLETEYLDALARVPPPASLESVWLLDRERPHRAHGYHCEPLPPLGDGVLAAPVDPGDTCAILYSSGTNGIAKGVCCPHAQLYWWGIAGSELLSIGADDVCFTTLPLFHASAISSLCQALVAGAAYVAAPRFTATRYWRLAGESGATRTYLLGAMVNMLLAQPPSKDDHGHEITVALAPATPPAACEPFAERFGVQLRDGYGSTETNLVTGVAGEEIHPGSLGRATGDYDLAVVDEHDARVADGEPGELLVRPRHPFSIATGYHGMPETTVAAWRNLWFHTGDHVVRDADGWYRLVGPARDAIRRRGESISSVEVEQALREHPAVAAVAVFPVTTSLADEEVMAAVVLEPGLQVEPLELVQFCEPRITRSAIPRFIDFVGALPLADNGNIRKSELRERGVTHATWDRERSGYRLARTR